MGTLLPKSPSKLLPMLKKKGESQSIQDKNSTENQNKRPTSSIFPFVQCASKEVKASDICLISDSDIEILSGERISRDLNVLFQDTLRECVCFSTKLRFDPCTHYLGVAYCRNLR